MGKRFKPSTNPYIPKPSAKQFVLPKLILPQTLDEYFSDLTLDVHACLNFLERFSDRDPLLKNLLEIYNSKSDKLSCSLDSLVQESQMEVGDFRRLILATLDYLCTDIAELKVSLTKPMMVEKSLSIALDETLEESQTERQWWLEKMGFKPIAKGQQLVNVNVAPVQNTVVQQGVVNGLPSFSKTLSESESLGKQALKEIKQANSHKQLEPMSSSYINLKEKEKENV